MKRLAIIVATALLMVPTAQAMDPVEHTIHNVAEQMPPEYGEPMEEYLLWMYHNVDDPNVPQKIAKTRALIQGLGNGFCGGFRSADEGQRPALTVENALDVAQLELSPLAIQIRILGYGVPFDSSGGGLSLNPLDPPLPAWGWYFIEYNPTAATCA